MDPRAMAPHGLALRAYFEGNTDATLTVHRDDGFSDSLPIRHFFREESEFSRLEVTALARCRGRVLDVGAGTGIHSLVLQAQGVDVTAIDINAHAVDIMVQRGVRKVIQTDLFDHSAGRYDTLLLLGRSIGMVETLGGLDRFFNFSCTLLEGDGQILLDSLDVRVVDHPAHTTYRAANQAAGRYVGESRTTLDFRGTVGELAGWIHVDPDALARSATSAGWSCEILVRDDDGDYLARLTRRSVSRPGEDTSHLT